MADREPIAELHQQFSSEGATSTAWAEARSLLESADVYWLSTVRPDGRPHVTPMVSIWLDGALYGARLRGLWRGRAGAGVRSASDHGLRLREGRVLQRNPLPLRAGGIV